MAEEQQKRQTAIKIGINHILNGEYITKEGFEPNYIALKNGMQISRANIIGVIVQKNEDENSPSLIIDDGTGKINIRAFEENKWIKEAKIGEPVLLIGKIRQYGNEKYIIPEIIKKINNTKWIELRKLELKQIKQEEVTQEPVKIETEQMEKEIADDNKEVYEKIKELDKGDGANIEDIIKEIKNGEEIVNALLEKGEVFEIKPGKIKVLE